MSLGLWVMVRNNKPLRRKFPWIGNCSLFLPVQTIQVVSYPLNLQEYVTVPLQTVSLLVSEYSDSDSSLSAPLMLDSTSSLSDSAEEESPGRAIILDSEGLRPGGASTSWTKAVPVNLLAAPESSGSTSEAWPVTIDAPPLRGAAAAAETMAEVGATYKRRKHVRARSVDGMSMDNIERSAWSPLPFELAYQQLCRPDYCASGPRPEFIADVMR